MVDCQQSTTTHVRPDWLRSLRAIPLAVGSIFVLRTAEYLLLRTLPTGWYQVVTSLTSAAVILSVLYLYLQWRDAARASAQTCDRLLHLERVRNETTELLVHDLKNQLTVVGGALFILGAEPMPTSEGDESHQEVLKCAANAQRRLVALLDQAIDLCSNDPAADPAAAQAPSALQAPRPRRQ